MNHLFDFDTLKKFDVKNMHEIYEKWPTIAHDSYNSDIEPVNFSKINHIIFSGMGGSGSLGDVFSSLMSQNSTHISVVKGYHLPSTIDENTLVIATSISGNTAETLSILQSAAKSKYKIIAFSSGGKIHDFCSKNKIEFRQIPMYHSPRASFPGFLYSMIKILEPIIPLKQKDVTQSITELQNTQKLISSSNLTENNPSLSLAKWISDIPVVYYPWGLQSAAIRFKNSIQENSKRHIMVEDVVESCHNGIVAWEQRTNIQPILLEGKDDHFKTKERWKILKEYFNKQEIEFRTVMSVKGSILSKIINLIYLLDYCSIYNAVLSEIDPSPIKSIDFIKKRL